MRRRWIRAGRVPADRYTRATRYCANRSRCRCVRRRNEAATGVAILRIFPRVLLLMLVMALDRTVCFVHQRVRMDCRSDRGTQSHEQRNHDNKKPPKVAFGGCEKSDVVGGAHADCSRAIQRPSTCGFHIKTRPWRHVLHSPSSHPTRRAPQRSRFEPVQRGWSPRASCPRTRDAIQSS